MTPRILFVHNAPRRFVTIDHDLLAEHYEVTEWHQRTRRVNVPKLIQAVQRCDLVYCWFASWHSLMPVLLARLFRKPSVVIIGGYDTANLPEAGYGSQRGGIRKWITRMVIKNATCLSAFSHSALDEARANIGEHLPPIQMIYLGIPPITDHFSPDRTRQVITVGGVWRENLLRKGLMPFVQAAHLLPNETFIHAGSWNDSSIEDLRAAACANVTFAGYVSDPELYALYATSQVYVQVSMHEGFGMSLAEAMSGGCIPVVTRVGSIPEVVGDAGIYVESTEPHAIAAAIDEALHLDAGAARRARDRILNCFPLENRRHALYSLIDRLIERKGTHEENHEPVALEPVAPVPPVAFSPAADPALTDAVPAIAPVVHTPRAAAIPDTPLPGSAILRQKPN